MPAQSSQFRYAARLAQNFSSSSVMTYAAKRLGTGHESLDARLPAEVPAEKISMRFNDLQVEHHEAQETAQLQSGSKHRSKYQSPSRILTGFVFVSAGASGMSASWVQCAYVHRLTAGILTDSMVTVVATWPAVSAIAEKQRLESSPTSATSEKRPPSLGCMSESSSDKLSTDSDAVIVTRAEPASRRGGTHRDASQGKEHCLFAFKDSLAVTAQLQPV